MCSSNKGFGWQWLIVVAACAVFPATVQAARPNVSRHSSDPSVVRVDKFGALTAHAPGTAKVSVYSWEDANPVAANEPEAFSRNGIHDSIKIELESQGKKKQ